MAASRFASRLSLASVRSVARGTTMVARPTLATGTRRAMTTQTANNGRKLHAGVAVAGAVGVGLATFALVNAEDVKIDYNAVRDSIREIIDNENYEDGSYGPVLVRLAWHASGTYDKNTDTGGSDGATMRFRPEAGHGANAGLSVARDLLEKVKQKHPEISYADLWTLAGAVAIEHMGGPHIPWQPGRSDAASEKACPPDGRLPDAAQGQDHIRDIFYRMGFNDQEIVALAGAHALGRCHKDRSGFDGPWTFAPTTFSNDYFVRLLEDKWTKRSWNGPEQFEDGTKKLMMLPADMAFVRDPDFRKWVELYAKDEDRFFKDFAAAFGKLLSLGCKNLHNEEQSWLDWLLGR